jgi:hypothetical protein
VDVVKLNQQDDPNEREEKKPSRYAPLDPLRQQLRKAIGASPKKQR